MERIEIDLGFATLVAEKGIDKDYRELNVYLEDKDGMWLQDIVVIGQKYHYEKDLAPVQDKGIVIRVWSDVNNENYTHKFNIDIYKEKN